MAKSKFTINSVSLHGRTVLVRADLNEIVEQGVILGDFRLRQLLPTLELLQTRRCRIVIMGHRGQPRERNESLSLQPIAEHLSRLLGREIGFVHNCIGPSVMVAVRQMRPGDIIMCENLRFHPEEYRNDPDFARALIHDTKADYVIHEAFSVLHRPHASIDAIQQFAPVLTGLGLAAEYRQLRRFATNPPRPNVAIIGGRDTDTKVQAMGGLLAQFDHLYVGGALAAEFIAYHRYAVGVSQTTKAGQAAIDEFYATTTRRVGFRDVGDVVRLPRDVIVRRGEQDVVVPLRSIKSTDQIIDLGPQAVEEIIEDLRTAQSALWCGPVGNVAMNDGVRGSFAIMQAMTSNDAQMSAILGGDTVRFVESFTPLDVFDLVSAGGAAALQLIAGRRLPGLDALLDAPRRVVYTERSKA